MRDDGGLPPPDDALPLTALEAAKLPAKPGIYAAWVVEDEALRSCGVEGPAPRLFYVGIATKRQGLRTRIGQHVRTPWYRLGELLAVRGHVLFPWQPRVWDTRPGRFKPGPLCEISDRQILDWQHRHICWSWTRCAVSTAVERERRAIEWGEPLLNRTHAGKELPQLRWSRGFRRARAHWLWRIAWAALGNEYRFAGGISKANADDWQLREEGLNHRLDRLGYPLPRSLWGDYGEKSVRLPVYYPEVPSLRKMMAEAARDAEPAIRHAIGRGLLADELRMWWGVHYPAKFLPEPWEPRDALAATLSMADEKHAPGPKTLPSRDLVEKLAVLERVISNVRH